MSTASTPCRSQCVIDERTKLCRGCGRTLEEIVCWIRLSEPERRAIMAELPRRLAEAHAPSAAGKGSI